MEYQKCFYQGCNELPFGYCDCNEYYTMFCPSHIREHMSSDERKHRFIDCYLNVPTESRNIIIKRLCDIKSDISSNIRYLTAKRNLLIETIIHSFDMSLNSLKNLEKYCNETIKYVSQSKISILDPSNITSILKLNPYEIEEKLESWDIIKPDLNFDQIIKFIEQFFRNKTYEFTYEKSPNLIFFQSQTKNLISYNVDEMNENKILDALSLTNNMDWSVSLCKIPSQRLFCYGRCCGNCFTFIIEKNKTIRDVALGKGNSLLKTVFMDSFVYAIGGEKNLAEKYNIETNSWEECSTLPFGNYSRSVSIVYNNKILIAARDMENIISYDKREDQYFQVQNLVLSKGLNKWLLTDNKRVYAIELTAGIYECEIDNLMIWKRVGDNQVKGRYITSFDVQYQNSFYLINSSYDLIKFSLSTKSLDVVKTIII
ncbi:unnamed protein product [Blepharisma stoltei]|uniref:Uncharacterized protein n=1 Tax=Blepharisma stoltei TaxID=1481888 RepID=A0AAU9I618_9CILI|nr:unnamed protein product [Blepharisma stoltei]